MPQPKRAYAFKVMATSANQLKKAMALTSLSYSLDKFPEIPMEKEPTYLSNAVLGKSFYRIYIDPALIEQCKLKLAWLKHHDIISSWDPDNMWNR